MNRPHLDTTVGVTRIRTIAALGAVLVAGAALGACGAIPGDAVVEVDGSPITKATFAHWMKVAKAPSKPGARYQAAKAEVLGFLISADWLIGESSSLGIKLSDAEVKRELVKEKVAAFPEPAKFKAYLHSSGETVSDLLLNLKVHLLGQKLEQRELKGKSQAAKEKAFEAFVKAFRKKWTAKTECRAGYVVEDCRQYKAPKPAPAPQPAPAPSQSKAPKAK
jgi:hypothetical protein